MRSFVEPSLVAALLAAVVGACVEAVVDGFSLAAAMASAGYWGAVCVPIGLVLSVLGRLLVAAWRPAEIAARVVDEVTGGAPRLGAWAVYLTVAGVALAFIVLNGMHEVIRASSAKVVYVLAAPMIAVATTLGLVALSRPAVDGIARGLGRIDRAVFARRGRSLFHPKAVVVGTVAVFGGLMVLAWQLSIRPRVGHIDLSFLPPLVAWAAVLCALPLVWRRIVDSRLARRVALGVALAVVGACVAIAVWMRVAQPFQMLSIWGESKISGFVIDKLFDLDDLRAELHLTSMKPEEKKGAAHPDLVLITIDTLRADRTPLYGGPAIMPQLAALGAKGAVFEWAFSPGNVTRRSLPSMAIGVTVPRLRGRVAGWALKLDPRHILLAERLRAAGYETAGFFCCLSQFGAEHKLGLARGIDKVVIDKDGEVLAKGVADFLAARERRIAKGKPRAPLFVWVHLIEPHGWEKAHPATAEARKREKRYDLALADVDLALGTLIEGIFAEPGSAERTVVALTSDHGEALGDHGFPYHATSLYNSEIRVPLVLVGPGIPQVRIPRPVGLHDMAPTLLDLAGFVPPGMPAMDGASLGPILRGEVPDTLESGEAYSAMVRDRSVPESSRAIIVGRHKLIDPGKNGKPELYDLILDPREQRNLAATKPAVLARLRARLDARRKTDPISAF